MIDGEEPDKTGASRRHSDIKTRSGRLSQRLLAAAIAASLAGCLWPTVEAYSQRVEPREALQKAVEEYRESLRKMIALQEQNVEAAKARHEKLKSLRDSNIVTEREVESAGLELARARAELATTRRELETLGNAGSSTLAVAKGETRGREVAPDADLEPPEVNGATPRRSPALRADALQPLAVSLSRITPRDEFESTAEYRLRLAGAVPTRRLTFLADRAAISVSYDADSEVMYVSLDQTGSGTGSRSVVVEVVDRTLGSYVGRTAYGSKRRVTRRERRLYGIAVYLEKAGAERDAGLAWGCGVQVPRGKAKALKGSIGIALVGRVDSTKPGVVPLESDSTFHKATIDDLVDLTVEKYLVRFRVEELLVVNRGSGEVLRRFLLSNDEFIGVYDVTAP